MMPSSKWRTQKCSKTSSKAMHKRAFIFKTL